jgi:Ca2+-dependent lipid-binding protein
MSKSYSSWDSVAIAIVSIFLGFVAFAFTQSIFNLFFVSIIVAILWNYTDKVKSLEERLSQIEAR